MAPRGWCERNPKKTWIIFCVLLLSLFGLIDVLFARHALRTNQRVRANERLYRIKSDIYHHDLAHNKTISTAKWGAMVYSVNTNSLGFKDHKVRDVDLLSTHHRIIFIGDSFTEGVGVEYQKTFVGIIGNVLDKKGVEVLNASVMSYSPIIYLTKIKYLITNVGLKFDELMVFLDISDIQDEAIYYDLDEAHHVIDNHAMLEHERAKGYHTCSHVGEERLLDQYLGKIQKYTLLTGTLITIAESIFQNSDHFFRKNNCATHLRRSMWTLDNDLYEEYGRIGLEKAKNHLTDLLNTLRKHGIKLIIAVYPWPDQIVNHDINSRQVSFWQKWAAENKITFLNYFPYFINERKYGEVLNAYFIPGDVHVNEMGHQLIANAFLDSYAKIEQTVQRHP